MIEWNGETNRVLNDLIVSAKIGYRTKLLTPKKNPLSRKAEQNGVEVRDFSFDSFRRLHEIFKLSKLLKAEPAFVVHTHSSKDTWLVAQQTFLFGKQFNFVRTRHNVNRIRQNPFNRWLYRRIDKIVALTDSVVQCFAPLVQQRVLNGDRFSVIPSAVDIEKFKPDVDSRRQIRAETGVAPDEILVGFVGRVAVDKGIFDFIEAVKSLGSRMDKLKFIIVGRCFEPHIEQAIGKLDSRKTIVAGFKENVQAYYQAIDIVVAPSLKEAQGTTIIEAMACGKPVVAARVGGIPEVISDGVDGVLVPSRAPEAIADAVEKLARDRAFRGRIGEAARTAAVKKYSFDVLRQKTENLYRSLETANGA